MHTLVVGSSVVDLFLSLNRDFYTISDRKVLLSLGDKIPAQIKSFATGGNGANVSVGLTRLGIPTTFYTYLGEDILSREIEEKLTSEGVELAADRHGGGAPLHMILDFDSDRIILSHYEKHEHEFNYEKPSTFEYIYLTSLADVWQSAYKQVLDFSRKNTIPIAYSPGSRQLEEIDELFYDMMKQTKLFFSNRDEAQKILKTDTQDIVDTLKGLQKLGPTVVSVTDGGNGAYALDEQGTAYKINPLPIESTERTGAGDAYATGFFAAFLNKKSMEECMKWGVFNASGVMGKVGAQAGLLTIKELDEQIKHDTILSVEKI